MAVVREASSVFSRRRDHLPMRTVQSGRVRASRSTKRSFGPHLGQTPCRQRYGGPRAGSLLIPAHQLLQVLGEERAVAVGGHLVDPLEPFGAARSALSHPAHPPRVKGELLQHAELDREVFDHVVAYLVESLGLDPSPLAGELVSSIKFKCGIKPF